MATLYALSLSHPSRAAHAMLERKGIEHRVVNLIPAFHPPVLRALGFPGWTVPALSIEGRRIQGSLEIARELERLKPKPPLYPAERRLRRRVEEAEAWGESELQPIPRRLGRWAAAHRQHVRHWLTAEIIGMPFPGPIALSQMPLAVVFALGTGATDDAVRADLEALPGMLDRVDALIADGTIGRKSPSAADFQIASTVRLLLTFEDLHDTIEERPAAELALRLFPDYPGPLPASLPEEWLPARR